MCCWPIPETLGAPIYVRHEVVHNKFVVDDLKARGAIFVEELDEVPDGNTVIFSAHGVSQAVRREADRRGLKVFDATCPLVTKVHLEVARQSRYGRDMVLIGHAGHPEVEGTMGQWSREGGPGEIHLVEDIDDVATLELAQPGNSSYTTQTTLSVDDTRDIIAALRAKFPAIQGPKNDDICYATQNRQDAVRELVGEGCDVVLVVGSPNSSNSNRLRELAEREGAAAWLIDGADEIDPCHCRRIRSGRAGARRARPPARTRCGQRARAAWRTRGHGVRAAEGIAAAAGGLMRRCRAGGAVSGLKKTGRPGKRRCAS